MREGKRLESWLEKLEGKKVRQVRKYECPQYSGEEFPQVVTFADGDERVWCEFLDRGICSKCYYFKPLKSYYS